jgi:hypothetical protein
VNVNVDRDVNVYGGGGRYYGPSYYRPVYPVGAAIATAVVIGAIVSSIPPDCTTIVVNGLSYRQCGSTWYQPQYSGSSTTYVVVNAPR